MGKENELFILRHYVLSSLREKDIPLSGEDLLRLVWSNVKNVQ